MAILRKPTVRVYKGRSLEPEEVVSALRKAENLVGKARRSLRPSAGEEVGGSILDAVRGELAELRKEVATGKTKIRGNRVIRKG